MPRPTSTVAVRDQVFVLERQLLEDVPDAPAFLAHLLDRGVAPNTARLYVLSICRVKRRGELGSKSISNVTAQTAVNAYKKWRTGLFVQRAADIAHAIPGLDPKRVRFLRRHSLSTPVPGKMIPVHELPGALATNVVNLADYAPKTSGELRAPIPIESSISWQPADDLWTLHVPKEFAAPHSDPCADCEVFVLDPVMIEAVAVAFEKTWGNRDLGALPPEAYLFGTPPAEDEEETARKADEKALAIVSAASTRAADMERIGVPTVLDIGAAIEKLPAVDGVYLSRAACGTRLQEVLGALWNAWGARG